MKNTLLIGICILALLLGIGVLINTTPDENGVAMEESEGEVLDTKDASLSSQSVAPSTSPASPNLARSALRLPEVPVEQVKEPEVTLWQVDPNDPDMLFDGHPAKRMHTDPSLIDTLHVGQTLHLDIPQRDISVAAEIASTHNLTPRTQMWQGKILDGHPQDNVVVTRGQIETHVTIATFDGTYSAVIDNATGDTVMIDEGDITVNQIPHEDGIPVDAVEQQPPAVVP